jgi:hypothetical protein
MPEELLPVEIGSRRRRRMRKPSPGNDACHATPRVRH